MENKQPGPRQIIVVEDIAEMRQLLDHVLSGIEGIKLIGQASNIWEARLVIARSRPDLVLLDEILPGESSYDFVDELNLANVPVLLITSIQNPTHSVPPKALGRLLKPGWQSISSDRKRFEDALGQVFAGLREKG